MFLSQSESTFLHESIKYVFSTLIVYLCKCSFFYSRHLQYIATCTCSCRKCLLQIYWLHVSNRFNQRCHVFLSTETGGFYHQSMFTQQTPWYKSRSLPVTTCPFLEHSSVFKETNTEYGKHIQSQVHASDILLYASVFLETKHFHFSSWNGWAELKTLYFFQYSMNSCRNRTGQYFFKHKCMRTICSFFYI